ncbi:MAG: phospholipase [Thioalkalivibrio sp.]|nr:phospholipase [Thioalkalivibrio sp.]
MRRGRAFLFVLVAVYLSTAAYHLYKPLPEGLDAVTPYRPAEAVEFLTDSTWMDPHGQRHTDHEIFDAVLEMVAQAESLIVADFFLVNRFAGAVDDTHRPLSTQFVDGLAERHAERPEIAALLITDPFNSLYNGVEQPLFSRLEAHGVPVIETDLRALRDPNPLWSAAWRICCQWFGNSPEDGWLPNPVGDTPVSLRTYLALLNFKANHRKTLIADGPEGWTGLVTSGNPHDASSRHHNIAVRFRGDAVIDLLHTERAVAAFSNGLPVAFPDPAAANEPHEAGDSSVRIRILTESRIRDAALEMIDGAGQGDRLDLWMFYLSHRAIVKSLLAAQQRGAELRVLLDPNRDAFGLEKRGIPNRQVALELNAAGVPVRWCNTTGEQCHAKMLLHRAPNGEATLLAGSANFTRRNLDNFNLETSVQLQADPGARVIADAVGVFDARWYNEQDRMHSLPYEEYADDSRLRYWRYRLMEATGLSSF